MVTASICDPIGLFIIVPYRNELSVSTLLNILLDDVIEIVAGSEIFTKGSQKATFRVELVMFGGPNIAVTATPVNRPRVDFGHLKIVSRIAIGSRHLERQREPHSSAR